MNYSFRLLPENGSSIAPQVDLLFAYIMGVATFFTILVFGLMIFMVVKYRRRPGVLPVQGHTNLLLELSYTIIPLFLVMIMFFWGAKVYNEIERPPQNAMEISVIGKQWMWQIQHPEGKKEINELHVPVGHNVKLTMTSQDVIHDFGLPDFRVKQDVLPGRYTTEWFKAVAPGNYYLFCQEYCGAFHSGMVGKVIAMEDKDYQAWLSGVTADRTPVDDGKQLFYQYGCNTCHGERAPTMAGLYNSNVKLTTGKTVVADEEYLRRSILNPAADIVNGYTPLMPTYAGQLSEEQLMNLIAYIKSLQNDSSEVKDSGSPRQPAAPTGAAEHGNGAGGG